VLIPLAGVMISGNAAVAAADLGLLPEPVGEGVLEDLRARENTGALQVGQLGRITEHAVLHDNVVVGGHSGSNVLGAGALDNARGIATVIQNSGHNVVIQESLIVNVTVAP
jgi:hypothetical protein